MKGPVGCEALYQAYSQPVNCTLIFFSEFLPQDFLFWLLRHGTSFTIYELIDRDHHAGR
jgi:hypothetical protein